MPQKDDVAKELIDHHFRIEPELQVVFRIISDDEDRPDTPIKLLEVNAATPATGKVEVFGFGATGDVPFSVEIAEITPDELKALQQRPEALPSGWDLDKAQKFPRPKAA